MSVEDLETFNSYSDTYITEVINAGIRSFGLRIKPERVYFLLNKASKRFVGADGEKYYMLVTPAVDSLGMTLPIDYYLDATRQPRSDMADLLLRINKKLSEIKKSYNENPSLFSSELDKLIGSHVDKDDKENIFKKIEDELTSIDFETDKLIRRVNLLVKAHMRKDIFDEIADVINKHQKSRFKIFIPYMIGASYWVAIEVTIKKNQNTYTIDIVSHDPVSANKLKDNLYESLCGTLRRKISAIDSKSNCVFKHSDSPLQSQPKLNTHMVSYSSVMVVEIILSCIASEKLISICDSSMLSDIEDKHFKNYLLAYNVTTQTPRSHSAKSRNSYNSRDSIEDSMRSSVENINQPIIQLDSKKTSVVPLRNIFRQTFGAKNSILFFSSIESDLNAASLMYFSVQGHRKNGRDTDNSVFRTFMSSDNQEKMSRFNIKNIELRKSKIDVEEIPELNQRAKKLFEEREIASSEIKATETRIEACKSVTSFKPSQETQNFELLLQLVSKYIASTSESDRQIILSEARKIANVNTRNRFLDLAVMHGKIELFSFLMKDIDTDIKHIQIHGKRFIMIAKLKKNNDMLTKIKFLVIGALIKGNNFQNLLDIVNSEKRVDQLFSIEQIASLSNRIKLFKNDKSAQALEAHLINIREQRINPP